MIIILRFFSISACLFLLFAAYFMYHVVSYHFYRPEVPFMQLRLDKENRELKSHGRYEFPVNVSYEQLSRYERGSFSWHWHPEIELTFVLSGQIEYQINGKSYTLKEGDGIFCNTNALHTGHMIDGMDCIYISTTFAPRFLYGFSNSIIQTRYVDPVLTDVQLASVVFSPDGDWQSRILKDMHRIYDLSLSEPAAFEMEIQKILLSIWIELYRHASFSGESQNTAAARDVERLRILLDYIHRHYMEHLTLEELSAQIHICRSECCRFFKKCMNESLFDYLLDYRIEKSLPLLGEHHLSVTETAELTGFSSPEYFAKVFREQMGCTPSFYRSGREKKNQNLI